MHVAVVLLVASSTLLQCSTGLFLSWKKRTNYTEHEIYIHIRKLALGKPFPDQEKFNNLSRLTLDERCQLGLPLSVAWVHNEPYTNTQSLSGGRYIGVLVHGIFPHVLKKMVNYCCSNRSEMTYGSLLRSVREGDRLLSSERPYDFTFPMYISKRNKHLYKGQPFIPIVTAPKVLLLVDDTHVDGTRKLTDTILSAWPFMMFILGAATAAGLIIWLLEHLIKPGHFSSSATTGVWEGFWWAVVTMTTVGYGDRSPSSMFGRVFCAIWIIVGINIIAIFTAIVTASVTASTQAHFNVLGAKIGAVNGSEEFRFGVSLNLDMKAYHLPAMMATELKNKTVDGILIDNYALTPFPDMMKDESIRLEKTYDHPITYGLVLSSGSEMMEECARRFVRDHAHEIFDDVSTYLVPLKNKGDQKTYAERASEGLFYQEETFTTLMRNGVIVVASLMCVGLIWELLFHRRILRKPKTAKTSANEIVTKTKKPRIVRLLGASTSDSEKELVLDFQRFHGLWIEKLSDLSLRKRKTTP